MSARAMLSDATRIVEIDMPYAEREGESKLRVIRDGFRFLRVILENAVLYKAGQIFSCGAAACFVTGVALMLRPLTVYVQTHTVADWMIYRFLVSSLAAQVAFLLLGAGMLSARIASIAIHEEVRDRRTPFSAWLRTGWFWSVAVTLTGAGLILVWPSALELWKTGKTHVHWSRFVVAMGCFSSVALFSVIRGLDRLLDLVEARVQHLWAK
jgi:hypothetical protein